MKEPFKEIIFQKVFDKNTSHICKTVPDNNIESENFNFLHVIPSVLHVLLCCSEIDVVKK